MSLDLKHIRSQFPILDQEIDGHPLIYLDSAATAQKPCAVLDAMDRFYGQANANAHRGMHVLAERATVAYEQARSRVRSFLNAVSDQEIIFTKNCTEALNLVAKSWGKANLKTGDTVALSVLEHHSNIVPWFQLKEEIGINIEWMDLNEIPHASFLKKKKTKLISMTGHSNVLGMQPPLKEIITAAHEANVHVCIDAAQLVTHSAVDVQNLDCDFLAFSGHKLYGPSGIGVLYGKKELLQSMPPFLGGGGMIETVTKKNFTNADLPQKFEAGTPPITEAVGLAAALDWISQFEWSGIEEHEENLIQSAISHLSTIDTLKILSLPTLEPSTQNLEPSQVQSLPSGCLSFTIDDIHPHDLTSILGEKGICLRAGHHCTQPLHDHLKIPASTRLSVGIYNTLEEIEKVAPAIQEAINTLRLNPVS